MRNLHSKATRFRTAALAAILMSGAGGALAAPALAAAPPQALSVDREMTVNGVEVACTGFGLDARRDPRWSRYGVRVEFSNARNEYLAGGAVRVFSAAGRELLSVTCEAPWVLLRLPRGVYRVEGQISEAAAKPRSARFTAPGTGQLRVVLQFVDAP